MGFFFFGLGWPIGGLVHSSRKIYLLGQNTLVVLSHQDHVSATWRGARCIGYIGLMELSTCWDISSSL